MVLLPGCKCCGGGGPCWRCYSDGTEYECVGPDDTATDGWLPVGKCYPDEESCAESCGDDGECWNCLTSSGATWGRIIYEAVISEINVPPELMSQTFNCGIWPGLRLRFESRQTASWDILLGPGYWCNCGGQEQRGGAVVIIQFEATNEENNSNNIDPSFQPIIVFDRGSNGLAGKVPQGDFYGTACNTLELPDGWETWRVEGFGEHEFSLNVVSPFTNDVIGTVKVQLRLTDKLLVQDLSDYPSNYFPINPSALDGCSSSVPEERLYKTVGSCKDTKAACEDFCQEPPPVRQWFQKKPCEQIFPCSVDGKRVKPAEEIEIDCSGLSASGWGQPSLPDGFTGDVGQFNSWVSSLAFSAFSASYPEQTPQTEYPAVGQWNFRGCVEFWEGGDPPFEGGGKAYCDRTGGNDLAGLYRTRPPDNLEICGTTEPGERPDIFGSGSFCSSIASTCSGSQWSASVANDFQLVQPFSNEGFCLIRKLTFVPPGSEGITATVNGMQVDISIPADMLSGSVSACGSYIDINGDTVLTYQSAAVILTGKITMSFALELWEEPTGVCCLPNGQCEENSTEASCYASCGIFQSGATLEECQNGIPGVAFPCFINTDIYECWEYSLGNPPPGYTPAGPIGEDCDYENGPSLSTTPTTPTPPGTRTMTTTKTTGGPGTQLKNLLKMIGINAQEKGCGCKSHSKRMNREGPQWCRDNIETILGWLQTEAKKRKLPFVKAAAKQVVLLAIRRAEK